MREEHHLAAYVDAAITKLAKRREFPGFGPTNDQIRDVLGQLSQSAELIESLFQIKADLLEVACPIVAGQLRRGVIDQARQERKTKKATAKQAKKRARKHLTQADDDLRVTPQVRNYIAAIAHPAAWEAKRLDQRLHAMTRTPLKYKDGKLVTGRRQDMPVKLVHAELHQYFKQHHSLRAQKRDAYIRNILRAFGFFYSDDIKAEETFTKRKYRLRKNSPSLILEPLKRPQNTSRKHHSS